MPFIPALPQEVALEERPFLFSHKDFPLLSLLQKEFMEMSGDFLGILSG
jgi:hypothetical protein